MSTRKRRRPPERGSGTAVTIVAGLLIALFTGLAAGPVLHLAARVLPTTENIVTVTGRSYTESTGYHPFRPVRLSDDRFSYFVTVRRDDGAMREIVAPKALYDAALPGLTMLYTVRLEQSVLLGVPVALSMEGLSADTTERYSLLIPLPGILIAGAFMLAIAGYLTWRILKRPEVKHPLLFAIISAGAALGAWIWA